MTYPEWYYIEEIGSREVGNTIYVTKIVSTYFMNVYCTQRNRTQTKPKLENQKKKKQKKKKKKKKKTRSLCEEETLVLVL